MFSSLRYAICHGIALEFSSHMKTDLTENGYRHWLGDGKLSGWFLWINWLEDAWAYSSFLWNFLDLNIPNRSSRHYIPLRLSHYRTNYLLSCPFSLLFRLYNRNYYRFDQFTDSLIQLKINSYYNAYSNKLKIVVCNELFRHTG